MVLALGHKFKPVQTDFSDGIFRAWHEYKKTPAVFKTGKTGMGAALDFGTPRHTAVSGKLQVSFTIFYFYYHFFLFSSLFFRYVLTYVSHCDMSDHCQPPALAITHLCK